MKDAMRRAGITLRKMLRGTKGEPMSQWVAIHLFNVAHSEHLALYRRNPKCPDGLPTGAVAVKPDHRADQIVDAIKTAAAGNPVKTLRIMCHGNAGLLEFPEMKHEFAISGRFARLFRERILYPLSRLDIHGCGLASDTSVLRAGADVTRPRPTDIVPGTFAGRSATGTGLRYLKRAASIFNVRTTAAIDAQYSMPWDVWSFEGNTVSAWPNSKFLVEADFTREWDNGALEVAASRYLQSIKTFIAKNMLMAARVQLRKLISDYPHTDAARIAQIILDTPNLDYDPLADP